VRDRPVLPAGFDRSFLNLWQSERNMSTIENIGNQIVLVAV